MTDRARPSVRIFRMAPGSSRGAGRLLLECEGTLYDLSAYLQRRGQPDDLIELAETGWFDAEQLGAILPCAAPELDEPSEGAAANEAAESAEAGSDDAAPAEAEASGDAPSDEEPAAEAAPAPPAKSPWEEVELEREAGSPVGTGLPFAPRAVGKILCLGKNFHAHAEEFGEAVPEEMLFFNKLPETLVPHGASVEVREWYTERVDHEAELAVVIGLGGQSIAVEDAMEHVAGYCIANDLTARTLQGRDKERRHPWFRSKNMDGFCPLGPCFVPRDFFSLEGRELRATVGGEVRQQAKLDDMVIDVPTAIARLSRHISLHPGDLILMGTPAGVGPLADGDEVVCSIDGLGELHTRIRRP